MGVLHHSLSNATTKKKEEEEEEASSGGGRSKICVEKIIIKTGASPLLFCPLLYNYAVDVGQMYK